MASFVDWKRLLAAGFERPPLALIVASYYGSSVSLTRSIQQLDRELAECERREARAARLQTMPKVGRIAALTFLATVAAVKHFPPSRKLIGYSGRAPCVRRSGERTE